MSKSDATHLEQAVAACYATWASSYFDQYYGDHAPYPPVHAEQILKMLEQGGVTTLLDAGCGPASFLQYLGHRPIAWHGFDLTPEMVAAGRRVADALGRTEAQIWIGSVLDDAAFTPPGAPVRFDGAVLVGVLPHLPAAAETAVLQRLARAVEPGGLLIAEARNALFGLFTLNRPSFELFLDRLIDWPALIAQANPAEQATLTGLREALAARFRIDLPPIRPSQAGEPGYDEILSRTHVPFELAEAARHAGWTEVELRYVHFHALPPMFERLLPELFRTASLNRERPDDWRGLIMASSFLIVGRRST